MFETELRNLLTCGENLRNKDLKIYACLNLYSQDSSILSTFCKKPY